jgi:hypothetical protein
MDEYMWIFRAHIFARIPDRLITSPILDERKKTDDPAENRGESPILGDDMRQTGEDMVLRLLSATYRCRVGCTVAPSNSALTMWASREAEGYKGHKTRPALD